MSDPVGKTASVQNNFSLEAVPTDQSIGGGERTMPMIESVDLPKWAIDYRTNPVAADGQESPIVNFFEKPKNVPEIIMTAAEVLVDEYRDLKYPDAMKAKWEIIGTANSLAKMKSEVVSFEHLFKAATMRWQMSMDRSWVSRQYSLVNEIAREIVECFPDMKTDKAALKGLTAEMSLIYQSEKFWKTNPQITINSFVRTVIRSAAVKAGIIGLDLKGSSKSKRSDKNKNRADVMDAAKKAGR